MSEDNEAVDGHPREQVGCGTAFKLKSIIYNNGGVRKMTEL